MIIDHTAERMLVFRSGRHRCGIPIGQVAEVMRPLPVQPLAGAPAFVLGLALIRGRGIPVVEVERLLEASAGAEVGRFITVHVAQRLVALAVGEVLGIRAVESAASAGMPPLVEQARPELITALATLDHGLLLVLGAARVVPEAVWEQVAAVQR